MPNWRPIPHVAYDKFKKGLSEHLWIHYLFHITYCWVRNNINQDYIYYTPPQWRDFLTKWE